MLFSLIALAATVSAVALPETASKTRQTCRTATVAELTAARTAFLAADIIPSTPAQFDPGNANVIPDFQPRAVLSVSYFNKAAELGNMFSGLETITPPTFTFTAEPDFNPATTKYTLLMLDPDTPPLLSPFLHWIISDAQADCIDGQNRLRVAPYFFPTPLSVEPHRYTFLIYRQPANYSAPAILQNLPGVRVRFPLEEYVRKYNLTGPVAGEFYREGLGNVLDVGTD